jgi:hypothetical protein
MRLLALPLLIAALGLYGCGGSLRSQPPPTWTTGFWFWDGSVAGTSPTSATLDVLYFQAGTISGRLRKELQGLYAALPEDLPPAREYWMVLRFDRQLVPDLEIAPILAKRLFELRAEAQQRHYNVVGVQLDIDSPTGNSAARRLPPNSMPRNGDRSSIVSASASASASPASDVPDLSKPMPHRNATGSTPTSLRSLLL